MSQLPIFDPEQLNAVTGGDADLNLEILHIFLQQAKSWSRLLDAKSDPQVWADGAHAIKGTALSVGAMQLADYCTHAEKRGREGDVPLLEATELVSNINNCLAHTQEIIAKALHKAESDRISSAV